MGTKRGIISFSLFSLIVFLFIGLLSFSYAITSYEKEEYITQLLRHEVLISEQVLLDYMVQAYSQKNTTILFFPKEQSSTILFSVDTTGVTVSNQGYGEEYSEEFSPLGMKFCSTYAISFLNNQSFLFNGTCILVS